MKSKLIGSLFVVLTLIVGIMAFAPSAFADTQVTMTKGSSSGQACVTANNCFDPANAQVAVGEAYKDTRQAGISRLSLNALVDFINLHQTDRLISMLSRNLGSFRQSGWTLTKSSK